MACLQYIFWTIAIAVILQNYKGIDASNFQPQISKECEELGFCKKVHNYPTQHVQTLIKQLGPSTKWLQMDKIHGHKFGRLGGTSNAQTLELCDSVQEMIYPFAGQDERNQWHMVINNPQNPVQGLLIDKCVMNGSNPSSCSKIATFQTGYKASCVQKFIYRKVAVIDSDGKPINKQLKFPSCCNCVAQTI